jgi:hypothetical protein
MPSPPHEILIEAFRREPTLAAELLRNVFRIEVPPFTRTDAVDTTLRDLLPVEHKADLLLLYGNDAPVFAVVVEVQLQADGEKPYRWPTYVAAVHDRHRCPTVLAVLAMDPAVASWARGPFPMGPGSMVTPVVLDASNVPRHDTLPPSERNAANVLLSVGVHVKSLADRSLFATALDPDLPGVDEFGGPSEYQKLLIAVLPKLLRAAVEEQMGVDVSDIVPWTDMLEARGVEKGRVEGRVEGRIEGRVEGRVEAARALFRRIAGERGLQLAAIHEARLAGCNDPDRLSDWAVRLLRAGSLDESMD